MKLHPSRLHFFIEAAPYHPTKAPKSPTSGLEEQAPTCTIQLQGKMPIGLQAYTCPQIGSSIWLVLIGTLRNHHIATGIAKKVYSNFHLYAWQQQIYSGQT